MSNFEARANLQNLIEFPKGDFAKGKRSKLEENDEFDVSVFLAYSDCPVFRELMNNALDIYKRCTNVSQPEGARNRKVISLGKDSRTLTKDHRVIDMINEIESNPLLKERTLNWFETFSSLGSVSANS